MGTGQSEEALAMELPFMHGHWPIRTGVRDGTTHRHGYWPIRTGVRRQGWNQHSCMGTDQSEQVLEMEPARMHEHRPIRTGVRGGTTMHAWAQTSRMEHRVCMGTGQSEQT